MIIYDYMWIYHSTAMEAMNAQWEPEGEFVLKGHGRRITDDYFGEQNEKGKNEPYK